LSNLPEGKTLQPRPELEAEVEGEDRFLSDPDLEMVPDVVVVVDVVVDAVVDVVVDVDAVLVVGTVDCRRSQH
jgi:hypothetical protein